ncbi:MAG: hypothetical protein HY243_06445 [Proteobacteria bacterium]|nr:hypothetical protein [Pseudomonadota bacterium]
MPEQYAANGTSANDASVKQYVKECKRLTAPPPETFEGYSRDESGAFARTSAGLSHIGSRYVVHILASDIGSAQHDALLAGAQRTANTICTGDYSFLRFQFRDRRSKSTRGKTTLDALLECSVDSDPVTSASSLTVAELAKNVPGSDQFDMHSAVIAASFDKTFTTIETLLKQLGAPVARADRDKGTMVTQDPGSNADNREMYAVALDPESATTTRVTFKVVEPARSSTSSADPSSSFNDREAANWRAAAFVASLQASVRK